MILVDTGPIVAVVNDRDDRHRECGYLLESGGIETGTGVES
ncbi:MAG: hypothetical protein ACRDTF_03345 [Pseudonocardiaceae bacterium]